MAITKEELGQALADMFAPKKNKKAKVAKFVLVVDGKALQNRPTTKKEVKKAVVAIAMRNPEAKISLYEYQGDLGFDMPISGLTTEEEV